MVFLSEKQNAHRRIIAVGHHVLFVPTHVGIELADVFVAEGRQLEFHQDMAFEYPVVKHQIDKIMRITHEDAFLPRFKTESMSQFQQKFPQLVQKLVFQMGFAHDLRWFDAEELKNVWISNREL